MKRIITLGLILVFACCASKKEKVLEQTLAVETISKCPEDGTCTIKVVANKTLQLKNDEFGKLYYKTMDDASKNIIIYTYNRKVPENVQDGTYREEIVIELDKLTGKATQSKLIFGRFCYCKGYTGYYKISDEVISENHNKNSLYKLNFKIKEVPQIIDFISFKTY